MLQWPTITGLFKLVEKRNDDIELDVEIIWKWLVTRSTRRPLLPRGGSCFLRIPANCLNSKKLPSVHSALRAHVSDLYPGPGTVFHSGKLYGVKTGLD